MTEVHKAQKVVVVGAGPVGALAALYAANRGDDVHVYELRAGKTSFLPTAYPCSIGARDVSLIPLLLLEEDRALFYHKQKVNFQQEALNQKKT